MLFLNNHYPSSIRPKVPRPFPVRWDSGNPLYSFTILLYMIKNVLLLIAMSALLTCPGLCESLNPAGKSPNSDGICTYRITNLKTSRFQATEVFQIKEEMAIIVKGYGGNQVTINIMDLPKNIVVFELVDFIPENKHKLWIWKSTQTGIFQAGLFVGGIKKDEVNFKVVP